MVICSESIESVQSQVHVSKMTVESANYVTQTNALTSSQDSSFIPQLKSSPVNDETETVPVQSWPNAVISGKVEISYM